MTTATDCYLDGVPASLREVPTWVNWRVVDRNGKATKLPLNPHTGDAASSTNPRTWAPLGTAVKNLRDGVGLGFVFYDGHPFSGIDLDRCRDPQTGSIAPWALTLARRMNTYCEVSPSATGIKGFFIGKLIGKGRRRGDVELYSRGRFFCVTGKRLSGFPLEPQPRQAEIDALVAQLFPPKESRPSPCRISSSMADAEILDRARRARNGERFDRLWRGQWQAAGYGSQSEADLALASMLSFWAGGDAARVDALFRQSALCREKWVERADYRAWTLAKATEGDVYDARRVA